VTIIKLQEPVCLIWSVIVSGRWSVPVMTSNETPTNIELQSTVAAALERSTAVESSVGRVGP